MKLNVDLSGEWIGNYPSVQQTIKITQQGTHVRAEKITSDNEFVPAGEVTFVADLCSGFGSGRIAQREFRRNGWVTGSLSVMDQNRISFRWHGFGAVEFRRDQN